MTEKRIFQSLHFPDLTPKWSDFKRQKGVTGEALPLTCFQWVAIEYYSLPSKLTYRNRQFPDFLFSKNVRKLDFFTRLAI